MNKTILLKDIDSKVYDEILSMVMDKLRDNETLIDEIETNIHIEDEDDLLTALESVARKHIEDNWSCVAEF